MQQDRLTVPAERLTAFLGDEPGWATDDRLTVLCGRSEADLAAVVDEVRRRHDGCFKVVDLSFSETTAGGELLTAAGPLPSLRGRQDGATAFTNLHRLPAASAEALVRQVAAAGVRCLATVVLPLPPHARFAFAAAFARLRRDGLVRPVTLRPVPRSELPDLVVSLTGALPETGLSDRLWSMTRGWPNAVGAALRIGVITVVDRHSYLSAWPARIQPAEHDDLLAGVRGLGLPVWSAAKTVAVLAPLGPAVPRLTGQALGVPEYEARELLGTLADAGVLLPVRARPVWRFRLPLLQFALRSALGPYERRRIAQIAVTALWQGSAECADPAFLADQLVDAGNLVDADRARTELLGQALHATPDDTDRPLRWLRAAADLAKKRTERARILVAHARSCLAHGAARQALCSTDTVLHEHVDDLPDDQLVDVCLSHLTALHAAGELDTLRQIADGTWWPWPGSEPQRAVGRAAALSLLGDWRPAEQVLAEVRGHPDAHTVERHVHDLLPVTRLWLGDSAAFDAEVASLPARVASGEELRHLLRRDAEVLVALGELRRAEPLLTGRLDTACLATLAAAGGRADEALELVRKSVATEPGTGCGPGQSVMFHLAATLLLRKGKLVRALEMVSAARDPALPHLLAAAEAAHHVLFGRDADAASVLAAALEKASEAGVIALTDLLWIALADIAVSRGDQLSLPCYLDSVTAVAKRMNTEQAEISRLVLHATVHTDRAAATEAARLLRGRPPLELADGMERLVRFGVGAPDLLSEAYEAAGAVDALLHRSVLRNLMRTHGIPVPGRQATVAENERLLAVLVTDGLGNKQIATLLDTSEKSVEGRLSRLFSRTGYRSRVELAAAMLTGRFTA